MTRSRETRGSAADWLSGIGPLDPEVRRAMRAVPREAFVPEPFVAMTHEDTPIPLPFGDATVSAPSMIAVMLESAELRPGQRVLDVGTGFGYLAALLAELVGPSGTVHSVEYEPMLAGEATRRLAATGYSDRVLVHVGDGAGGWPPAAPFDRILCSCAVPDILQSWRAQLAPEGLAAAPVGDALGQRWTRWRPVGPSGRYEIGVACRFVPMRRFLPSDI